MLFLKTLNKILVLFSFLYNIVIAIDYIFGINFYDKYLYYKPLHNYIIGFSFVMILFQIIWLMIGYFSTDKIFNYIMVFNILLFAVLFYYGLRNDL